MPSYIPIGNTVSIPELSFNNDIQPTDELIVAKPDVGDYKITVSSLRDWVVTDIGSPQSFNVINTSSTSYDVTTTIFLNGADYYDIIYVRMDSSVSNVVNLSTDLSTLRTGVQITIRQVGTGITTIVAGSGVTINGNLIFHSEDDTKTLIKVGANTWDIIGAAIFEENFVRINMLQNLSNNLKYTAMQNIGALKTYNLIDTAASNYVISNVECEDGVDFYDLLYIRPTSSSANTVTLTTSLTDLPEGFQISIRQGGTGTTTLVADTGVTLNGNPTFIAQTDTKTLVKVGANEWDIIGSNVIDLSPFEILTNKATDFSIINDNLYPSVQAVEDRVQSIVLSNDSDNVKITPQIFTDSEKNIAQDNIGSLQNYNYIENNTTSYTLASTDFKNAVDNYDYVYLKMTSSSPNTVVIDGSVGTVKIGSQITIRQGGAGLTVITNSGVTINGNLEFNGIDDTKTIVKVGANTWDVIGARVLDFSLFETTDNKATDFSVVNDILYPTVQAVEDRISLIDVSPRAFNVIQETSTYHLLDINDFKTFTDYYDYVYLQMTSSSANIVELGISLSALNVGSHVIIRQAGTGATTLTATGGISLTGDLTFSGIYDVKTLVKTDTLVWDIISDAVSDLSPYELLANKATNLTSPDNTKYPTTLAVKNALDLKLDASSYNNHYRGTYISLSALQTAIPTGITGDYAIVDTGTSSNATIYIWDVNDSSWVLSSGTGGPSTTDALAEGSTNLYFTNARVSSVGGTYFIRYDASQSLSGGQKTQVYTNLGLGDVVTHAYSEFEIVTNKATNLSSPDNTKYPTTLAVKNALDLKLDASSYSNHYRGTYTTLGNLNSAVPTGSAGDYAIVDTGVSGTAYTYIWDSSDNAWVLSSGAGGPSTTDALTEGTTNLYFTSARVSSVGGTYFVRYDASQSLSGGQKTQVYTNLGLGDVVTHAYSEFEIVTNKSTNLTSPDNTKYPTTLAVKNALDLKLDTSSYNNHYRGTYTTLGNLNTAVPTGSAGDYAIVDTGVSGTAYIYIWDSSDNAWTLSSGSGGPSTTDALAEGSTNLYFTTSRAVTSGATAFVRYDTTQSLSGGQQTQARTNLGLGTISTFASTDYVAVTDVRYVFNAQSGTSYAVVAGDVTSGGRGLIVATNASAISVTIGTPSGLGKSVGDSVTVVQGGAGIVTVTASGGASLSSTAVFAGIGKAMTFIADTTTSWRVIGV